MIGIVNYGVGNVQAIANIYKKLNIPAAAASTSQELRAASRLILPGVGSFDWAMTRLEESGMRQTLDELVMREGKPVLGICVGMQMMARSSEEGKLPGLGWIDAQVKRFDDSTFTQKTRLPHMGWNDVIPAARTDRLAGLWAGMETPLRFYFLHSYYVVPARTEDTLATTDYNGLFTCAAGHGVVAGVQFHPEKSHQWGVQLLRNFAEI